jgi:hypothetical protein
VATAGLPNTLDIGSDAMPAVAAVAWRNARREIMVCSDKPLLDAAGRRLENFTRVETFGDNAANGTNDVHWVKALVDAKSRDVFAFQAQMVSANFVTH